MRSRWRTAVAPLYLFACLLLGGSAQGIWQNMVLQLAGVLIICWAALGRTDEPLAPAARRLFLLALAAVAVVALQLIPLPPALWADLGPRSRIAQDMLAVGLQVPAEPLSLSPAASLSSLLGIIPPLAMLCAIVSLKAYRQQWIVVALVAATMAGVCLGALQVASSRAELSPWYLYPETNPGRAVGPFANANHMATLLVLVIPFLAAGVAAVRATGPQRYSAATAAAAAVGLVIIAGLALNGSLAGLGLTLPVLAASVLIVLPRRSRLRSWLGAAAALMLAGALVALVISPIGSARLGAHANISVNSRAEILSNTVRAASDFMPFGSGLGTFPDIYALYERTAQVTNTYVVHAHNDYVELVLELGLAGVILLILFLAWWGAAVWRVWASAESGPFARAATIATAAILVHSLVDFPLRTAAIATCFAMCLALLADGRAPARPQAGDLRAARHRLIR